MSRKFDWQTEEEAVWDDLPDNSEKEQTSRRRRRWPIILLIFLLLAGAGWAVLRQVNQRVESNSEAMRTDIVSSYNLIQLAAEEQDEELFTSILSGRDSDWTTAQSDLFKAGLLKNRTPFGLHLPDNQPFALEEDDENLNITFSPNMLEATMVRTQPYATSVGAGLTETVSLQETSIYRLGRERWLLAPPLSDFWGSRETLQGNNVKISFPERDKEWAARLLPDLERKLNEMCQTLQDIECPVDRQVEIQLSADPATLAATALPQAARRTNDALRIMLPTPTLVGLPVDEAGYQALYRGYASQMVTALVARFVAYDCCDQLPFFQALVDYQLGQISLKPWPVTAEDYERIRDEQMQLTDLAELWHSENPDILLNEDGWRVFVVVDYLLQATPEISPATLQRELSRRGSFFGWLNGAYADDRDGTNSGLHSDLMRQFWLQAYPEATQAGSGFTVPPPKQDLHLVCVIADDAESSTGQISKLFRYNVLQDDWMEEFNTPNYLFVSPLPGDEQLLLLEVMVDSGRWQTGIWRDGGWQPILGERGEYMVSFGHTDPTHTELLGFVFPPDGQDADIMLFNLNDCNAARGCTSQIIPAIPAWSPDGSHAVFGGEPNAQLGLIQRERQTVLFDSSAPTQNLALHYADRPTLIAGEPITKVASLPRIGEGHAPFWLDNETVAYIAGMDGRFSRPAQEIVFTPAGEDNPQLLLNIEDLLEATQDQAPLERLFWIHYVMVHPDNDELLLVAAFVAWDQQIQLFSYERSSRTVKHLMNAGYTANHTLSISPDGRFLVMTGNDVDDPDRKRENMLLQVYDIQTGDNTPFLAVGADFPPFTTYDWSADGRWLAMMLDQNLIGLYAPLEGALHLIQTTASRCTSPSWINR